jgi:putative addiction module killer protein
MVVYELRGKAVIVLKETETFQMWRSKLKEKRLRLIIASRLDRLKYGNLGDVKPVGEGVSELRIDYGPGYRIYFQKRGSTIIVLLCGGNKTSQPRDIAAAKLLAREWSHEDG